MTRRSSSPPIPADHLVHLRRRPFVFDCSTAVFPPEEHKALVKTAAEVIPAGSVWSADKDASALKAAKPYKHAGSLPIAGGIVVESEDGRTRLDLSYETLLDGIWRDVLKAEAELFR